MDHFEKTKRDAKFDWIWYGRLDRLLRYKREYHTFTVSKSDNKHKKLRAWVIRQREMEKENKLAEQRKKMLMNVGFDFSHRFASRKRKYTSEQENAWNEMYNKLVDFRKKKAIATSVSTTRRIRNWPYGLIHSGQPTKKEK